jgi:hypothetical protein
VDPSENPLGTSIYTSIRPREHWVYSIEHLLSTLQRNGRHEVSPDRNTMRRVRTSGPRQPHFQTCDRNSDPLYMFLRYWP